MKKAFTNSPLPKLILLIRDTSAGIVFALAFLLDPGWSSPWTTLIALPILVLATVGLMGLVAKDFQLSLILKNLLRAHPTLAPPRYTYPCSNLLTRLNPGLRPNAQSIPPAYWRLMQNQMPSNS